MSQLEPAVVTCPACSASWSMALFRSIDADTIQAQVDAILDDQFERQHCTGCGLSFRPEHGLLFVSHARRLWVVLQPLADRARFASLENDVEDIITQQFEQATPLIAERLASVQPRLVFGQHMLTELVRATWAGIDARLLECAKLLTIRRSLAVLMPHGAFELCFERFEDNAPVCAIRALPDGVRLGELAMPPDIFAEAGAVQAEMRVRFPDLFERPYVSASRYLIDATL